jgi:chaperonin GroES
VAKGKAKKAVTKKSPAKKTPAKKAAPKKAAPKKAAPKKVAAKKAAPKKAVAKKTAAAKKPAAKKAVAKKATVKKTAVKSAPVKATAMKATPAKAFSAPSTKKVDLSNFVTPLDDRLMVQLTGAEKMTAGGLYIPDTVADVSGNLQGFVVSVGRGHRNRKGQVRPMDLKVGDKILFSEYAGTKLKIQNQDVLILRESDVLGVVG